MTQTLVRRIAVSASMLFAAAILVLSVAGPPPPMGLPNADKFQHALAYFALGFVLTLAARAGIPPDRARLRGTLALVGCILYGFALEVIQPTVGRNGDVLDALADLVGALLGWGAAYLAERAMRRHLRER